MISLLKKLHFHYGYVIAQSLLEMGQTTDFDYLLLNIDPLESLGLAPVDFAEKVQTVV